MNRPVTLTCYALLLIVAGCATVAPPSIPATITQAPIKIASAADSLVAELARLQAMPPAALATVKESARDAFERDPADFRRVFYALTLFVAPSSPADDDRLLAIVEPLIISGKPVEEAARVVVALALANAVARKKIRDEAILQRNRVAAAGKRDDREAENRVLKQRVDELEKQLVALKSINRSVTSR